MDEMYIKMFFFFQLWIIFSNLCHTFKQIQQIYVIFTSLEQNCTNTYITSIYNFNHAVWIQLHMANNVWFIMDDNE